METRRGAKQQKQTSPVPVVIPILFNLVKEFLEPLTNSSHWKPNHPVYLKYLGPDIGYGLFATRNIPKGAIVAYNLISTNAPTQNCPDATHYAYAKFNKDETAYPCSNQFVCVHFDDEWDEQKISPPLAMFCNEPTDSSNPNAEIDNHSVTLLGNSIYACPGEVDGKSNKPYAMIIRTTKYIKKDQQITVSYGSRYDRSHYPSPNTTKIFKRPRGRAPKNTVWCSKTGKYVTDIQLLDPISTKTKSTPMKSTYNPKSCTNLLRKVFGQGKCNCPNKKPNARWKGKLYHRTCYNHTRQMKLLEQAIQKEELEIDTFNCSNTKQIIIASASKLELVNLAQVLQLSN